MKKRGSGGTFIQKPARQSRKKVCDLGHTCPYQEEYQHLLEFSHDCAPAPTARNAPNRNSQTFVGSGNRLGGTPGFAGGGNRLGGSAEPSWNRNIPAMWEDAVQCEFCSAKVSLMELATHLAQHEERIVGDSLKNEQDSALEESILLDVQKRSNDESELREKEAKEREAVEKKEMEQALAISMAELHRVERESAEQNLLPEPGPEYTDGKIVLKFTVTGSIKLKRTFRSKNLVTDAFQFLRTQKELEGKQFSLRDAVNTLSLEVSDTRTFESAGVLSNSSLLVVVASDDPPPVLALPEASSSGASTCSSSGGAMRAPVMSGVKRPFDKLDTNGPTSTNGSSSSSNNRSSSSSDGVGAKEGGSTALEPSRQQQQQQVVDLLADSPALPTAVRKRPVPQIHPEPQQGGDGNSRSSHTQQLHTPHRAARGDAAAVIDLTLS